MNFEDPSAKDWDEFDRQLANDDGAVAKEHLAEAAPSTTRVGHARRYLTEGGRRRLRPDRFNQR